LGRIWYARASSASCYSSSRTPKDKLDLNSAAVVRQCDVTQAMLGAVPALPFLERRGPPWTNRRFEIEWSYQRHNTRLYCSTARVIRWPYWKTAKRSSCRSTQTKKPSFATIYINPQYPYSGLVSGPAEKQETRALQVWEPGTCTRVGNAALSEFGAVLRRSYNHPKLCMFRNGFRATT
jgi:hypothetical protein